MSLKKIALLALRIIAAVILLQTLYFKFTAQPESVILFSKLGVEPWGRIGTGVIELITGLLLLIPSTVFVGAFLGIGLMAGAILSHIVVLGIVSQGDGGQLFMLAIVVFISCVALVIFYKQQGNTLYKKILGNRA
jgi:uncharacterized membrane protein YphA (DoxX/SURF4 family)